MALRNRSHVLAAIALLTMPFAAPIASAAPSQSSNAVHQEASSGQVNALEDNIPEEVKVRAVEEALQQVENPVADPTAFEQAVALSIQQQNNPTGTAQPRAIPVVIIAARIAGCAAGAYTSLAALDPNAGYAHNAMVMGSILVGCIGGGVTGKAVGQWILNNPRTFGVILNGIGLGHLAADAPQ